MTALNLAQLLSSRSGSDAPALSGSAGDLSYRQLNQLVAAARCELQELGLQPGERAALMMPNIPAMPVYYYAIISLGAICVPLNPLLSEAEVRYQLEDCQASVLIAWDGSRTLAEGVDFGSLPLLALSAGQSLALGEEGWQAAETDQDSPAVILYTSGTTGHPKGAVLSHRNLWANATTVADVFDYTEQDVFFGGLPLFHSFGQTVSLNAVFAAGASVALLPRFSPDAAVRLCAEAGVTIIAAVPTMYTAMAAFLEENPVEGLAGSIRYGISGGSALPESTHADFMRLLQCPILEGYGLSETAPVVSFNQPRFRPVLGSVGRPLSGVQVQVRDEAGRVLAPGQRGQLWVQGPNVMLGYWKLPVETAAVMDGPWLATGDVATLDEEGNIFIVDRIKDMILRNGYSVYPREIEDVIYQHPLVRMVAVVGQSDERVGEEVRALIIPREPLDAQQEASFLSEVDSLCREQLAAYKYPRILELVEQLPLGPTGKILKKDLRR